MQLPMSLLRYHGQIPRVVVQFVVIYMMNVQPIRKSLQAQERSHYMTVFQYVLAIYLDLMVPILGQGTFLVPMVLGTTLALHRVPLPHLRSRISKSFLCSQLLFRKMFVKNVTNIVISSPHQNCC